MSEILIIYISDYVYHVDIFPITRLYFMEQNSQSIMQETQYFLLIISCLRLIEDFVFKCIIEQTTKTKHCEKAIKQSW